MRPSSAVLVAAFAANVLGWLLPAFDGERGFVAFAVSLSPLLAMEEFGGEPLWFTVVVVSSGLTNVLFLALAVLLIRGRIGGLVLWGAAAATLLNLHWVITLESDRRLLEAGYFVWVCSFALLTLAAFLARETPSGRR